MQHRTLRLPSRAFVQVRAPLGAFDATLGNVTAAGARLLGVPDRKLRVGDWIDILCASHQYPAEVRWHFDDTCGLMFETPLTDYQIMVLMGARSGF